MKAAAEDFRGQRHVRYADSARVTWIAALSDVVGKRVHRDIGAQATRFTLELHPLGPAIDDARNNGGEREDARWQPIQAEDRVHERGLSATEASSHEQHEAVFRESDKKIANLIFAEWCLSPAALRRASA